ncbi:MAG: PEP-CTERM sorting domain-containing protein [Nitrospirae bacterium]|nr:PEP-CTERM sorting domain-containing protein [Nitrospirota bacterium]
MKRIFGLLMALMMVWGFSGQAQATLILRGTDTLGNPLIYDNDLNITWYGNSNLPNIWQNQVDWASALTVNFGSTVYTDWRLPATVDGEYNYGYDGTTTVGYNITNSEMGHLYYTELGNLGAEDTSGAWQSDQGLKHPGDFILSNGPYWSGTEHSAALGWAWYFSFYNGFQNTIKTEGTYAEIDYYALAVRPGNVVIPEPGTMFLLGSGLIGLVGFRRTFRKR